MVVAFSSMFVAAMLVPQTQASANEPGECQNVKIPVALSEGGVRDQTIAATLCTPTKWAPGGKQVDVLVPGSTYNRDYWDWPGDSHQASTQDSARYSYVDRTLAAGRATLNYDRLGTGESSHPASLRVTVPAHGYSLHQLVTWVRERGYPTVNGIGHSLGSITVTNEASRWHDLNRVVVTGILHLPAIGLNGVGFSTSLYPAILDPKFAKAGLDAGYLTTMPGRRGPNFYDPSTADKAVIAYDEANKDVSSAAELQAILELETPAVLNATTKITAPILVVMGETDNIFCNVAVNCAKPESIRGNEIRFYRNAASLSVATVPNTAHNLTLHPSAGQSFGDINTWISTH